MHRHALPIWREILSRNFTKLDKLADFLELNDSQRQGLLSSPKFPLNVPYRLASKISKGTLEDPLLKQFIPSHLENGSPTQGFCSDPVSDAEYRASAKLLHKYQGRMLIVATGVCAMHCRYCFRQNFEYERQNKTFDDELHLIAEDPSINEIILSGGDPLALSNEILRDLLQKIGNIPHIRKVRFHTRFPIGIPERIDEGFLEVLNKASFQIIFVIHCNHPSELDEEVLEALNLIRRQGVVLLNQSVLLKGVNDSVETLFELCNLLVDNGILPYYLHQLDRVAGAAHFEVREEKGKELIDELMKKLPGYAIPKYVREIPGEPYKTPLFNG